MFGFPLMRTGGALRHFPFVTEQVRKEVVAPLRRRRGPRDFEAAGDRVASVARAKGVPPAKALFFDAGTFRFRTDVLARVGSAMGLAERVSAGDEGSRVLVVHRNARERLADIAGGSEWVRIAVRTFRIDVNQTHLDRTERIRK